MFNGDNTARATARRVGVRVPRWGAPLSSWQTVWSSRGPPHCRHQHLAAPLRHPARKHGCKWSCANYARVRVRGWRGSSGFQKDAFLSPPWAKEEWKGDGREAVICHRQEVLQKRAGFEQRRNFPSSSCLSSVEEGLDRQPNYFKRRCRKTGTLWQIRVHRKTTWLKSQSVRGRELGNTLESESHSFNSIFWFIGKNSSVRAELYAVSA